MVNNTETTDPSVINRLAEEVTKEPEAEVKTVTPSNTDVSLPGGFIAGDGSLVKYAEVRELNGLDEEVIAKAGTTGKVLTTMLQRGLVALGSEKPSKEDLDKLLGGDRDAILVGIRRATFGDVVEQSTVCPSCATELEVDINLVTDIPSYDLEDPFEDRKFTYKSSKGEEIVVSLPTGRTQRKILDNLDKTRAEMNTILLTDCVESVNNRGSLGTATAQSLGMKDREDIISEIVKRNPGPRLGEVKTTCEACGEDVPVPLSLADLFRL